MTIATEVTTIIQKGPNFDAVKHTKNNTYTNLPAEDDLQKKERKKERKNIEIYLFFLSLNFFFQLKIDAFLFLHAWNSYQNFFHVFTLGYGHMTPETMLGQLLTVLYAIVGLPISMLALKTIGEVIVGLVQSSVLGIERRLFKTTRALNIRLKTFLLTCFLMVCFLLLGALIQIMAEGWSFVEGIYTWFIILSTIGFGDYIPFQSLDQKSDQNQQRGLWFFIIAMAFITLAGLSVVSAVLTSLVQAVEEYRSKIKNTFKRIELLKRKKRTVSRSKMYLYVANHGSLGEIQHYAESDVSLEENRRVRSKTV